MLEEKKLSFGVLSDIHSDGIKLKRAIKDLYKIDMKTDALILNGDTVDLGYNREYKKIQKALKSSENQIPGKIIISLGNHEFYKYYGHGPNTEAEEKELINNFLKFTGKEKVYSDCWIKGYHFISLGSEKTYTFDQPSTVQAYLSESQLKWFEEKINEEYEKNKYIFVIFHLPPDDTVKFSHYYKENIKQEERFLKIIQKYPNIVYLTGHSHISPLVYDNIFYKSPYGYLMIDSSSVSRPVILDESTGEEKNLPGGRSFGLYFQIYDESMEIKVRDFSKHEWIGESHRYFNK